MPFSLRPVVGPPLRRTGWRTASRRRSSRRSRPFPASARRPAGRRSPRSAAFPTAPRPAPAAAARPRRPDCVCCCCSCDSCGCTSREEFGARPGQVRGVESLEIQDRRQRVLVVDRLGERQASTMVAPGSQHRREAPVARGRRRALPAQRLRDALQRERVVGGRLGMAARPARAVAASRLQIVRHELLYAGIDPQVLAQVEDQLEAQAVVAVGREERRPVETGPDSGNSTPREREQLLHRVAVEACRSACGPRCAAPRSPPRPGSS